MTSTDQNNHASPQANSPAISPADLAKLLSNRLAEGFQPRAPHRPSVVTEGSDFVATDFRDPRHGQPKAAPQVAQHTAKVAADRADKVTAPLKENIHVPDKNDAEDHKAALQAAYERGLSEGKAQGAAEARQSLIAEAEEGLGKAKELFHAAAQALTHPPADSVSEFAPTIAQAIARLASERAGIQISEHPEAFLNRINAVADRVSQGIREVTIFLNGQDLEILQKHLDPDASSTLNLSASKSLGRGDIEVRCAGICLRDILDHGTAGALK